MRSLFARIVLWLVVTVVLTNIGFVLTAMRLSAPDDFFRRTQEFQLGEARRAFEEEGSEGLGRLLDRFDRAFRARHFVTDAEGRDLAGRPDAAALLARIRPFPGPVGPDGRVVFVAARDGRYQLVLALHPPFGPRSLIRAFAWVPVLVGALCYLPAVHIAAPLRRLRATVDRFGHGDLSARARSGRRDEIGDLARAFDGMADGIESLRSAERRLLQDVAHELRSPLARLRFAVGLAWDRPDRTDALERIDRDVHRLGELVGQVLDLSRLESGVDRLRRVPVDLGALLRSIGGDVEIEARARPCRLVVRVDQPAVVTGDAEALRRAVENVVRNAIGHAPPESEVCLGLAADCDGATISVSDRGPGVPDDALAELFRPFYRVEGDRSRSSGGVGLGLAIADRAVRAHGGTIEAANTWPGLRIQIILRTKATGGVPSIR